jgi:mannitol/fructose-specific phosphotransferase system IIA component (Ntr-type)
MLTDYITPDLIQLQVAVKDWRGAVRQGGELLQRAGICEARYVDAMIRAVEQLGPYMVLAPGLALAHARPEDGVIKVGMSIITLSTPVDFGSKENDPVKLVISFGGIDKTSHIGMLQELARFLMVPENQEFLRNASSIDEIMKVLKQ